MIARSLRALAMLLLLCLAPWPGAAGSAPLPAEKQASLAALDFLEQLDRGEYAAAWQSSSTDFRQRIAQQKWLEQINHLRPHYGASRQRQLHLVKPIDSSAETGFQPLMFLIFRTTFAQQTAIEMVTMVKDPDDLWRVAGYSLQ